MPVKGMPNAWRKRADFWVKAFKSLPELAPIVPQAVPLMSDIVIAARDRGIFMHSMWGAFLPTDPLSIESISLRFEGDHMAAGNTAITLSTVERMTYEANTLNSRLVPISMFLGSVRPAPKNAQPALRPKESLIPR